MEFSMEHHRIIISFYTTSDNPGQPYIWLFESLFEFYQGSAPTAGLKGCISIGFYHRIIFQKPLNPFFQYSPALSMNDSYRINTCIDTSGKVIDQKIRNLIGFKGVKI